MTTIVDREGRLFGRVNLIDAAIVGALLVAVPLAYGAILLFRPPTPKIVSVERVPLSNVEERTAGGVSLGGKLKVHGTGLRPNMRVEIGGHRAIAFVFETTQSADIIFGSDIEPGRHDLVLFDGQQQIGRAAGAVTIEAPPPRPSARVRVVGAIIDLDESRARAVQQGTAFHEGNIEAVVDALDSPLEETHELTQRGGSIDVPVAGLWQRPAAVVMTCEPDPTGCRIGTTLLEAGAVVRLPGARDLKLRVDEVLPANSPRTATVHVRLVGTPEAIAGVKIGDRDRGSQALTARSASLESIANRRETAGDIVTFAQRPAGAVLAWATDRVTVIDATLKVAVDPAADGWRYRSQPVKAGAPFTFESATYTLQGTILSLEVDAGGTRGAAR